MFETAEVGNKLSKTVYNREAPKIREALLQVQTELAGSNLAVIVVIGGVEGAGKSETLNLLYEWMDARGLETHAAWIPTEDERQRPPMWRFWRLLPPRGRVGIFYGSWYSAPILDRAFRRNTPAEFSEAMGRINDFERMLEQEDCLVIKFWLHMSRKEQAKRLKALSKDPHEAWRVTEMDWKFHKKYNRFRKVSERALRETSTGYAPWHIVEGTDRRWRSVRVTRILLDSIRARLDRMKKEPKPRPKPDRPVPAPNNILARLDGKKKLSDAESDKGLLKQMGRVNLLARKLWDAKRSLVLVFEGPDAAGKGGAIRRLCSAMDARNYRVISVAAPTDEERARPYLWRFWRNIPAPGKVVIFDRSWYGRILVERIEGFCAEEDWKRAFVEINEFEEQLTEFGIVVLKLWIHISPDEQLRRFKSREVTPYKQYKLTPEDWRNRAKWGAYEAAACDMVEKTSTSDAPWVLVEGNDKNWARMKVLTSVADRLEKALGR